MIASAYHAPRLREELAHRARAAEVALLLAVPGVLVAVWLAGEPARTVLAFDPADPSPLAAFTAHYVHASADHLAGNLVVYAAAVGLGYPLAVLAGCRRRYLAYVVGVLLGVPVALSSFHLAVVGEGVLVGFSGVALALVGLLPSTLVGYLRSRVHAAVAPGDAVGVFLLGTAALAWPAVGADAGVLAFAVGVGAVGLVTLVPLARRLRAGGRSSVAPGLDWSHAGLPLAAVAGLFLALATGAGAGDGPTSALVLHLLGYTLGFVGAFGTAGWLRARAPPSPPAADG